MGTQNLKTTQHENLLQPASDRSLIDYITQAQNAQSAEDLHTLCSHITQDHDYDHFIYAARFIQPGEEPHMLIISGYPDDWRQHYVEHDYQPKDPTVTHCITRLAPILWDDVASNVPHIDIMHAARDFGLKNGLSIPIHGVHGDIGMFSLCNDRFHQQKSQNDSFRTLPHLDLLSKYIHEATCRIMMSDQGPVTHVKLTPREKEVLQWVAAGKESWVIAELLSIAERTILFHINNICSKLGVHKRQHAVAKAVALRLISL